MTNIIINYVQRLLDKFIRHKPDNEIASSRTINADRDINARDIVQGNKITNIRKYQQQHSSQSHPNIQMKLKDSYISDHPDKRRFAELKAPENSSIADFVFMDPKNKKIGRFTGFGKVSRSDNHLTSNYWIDDRAGREAFLEVLRKQNGIVKAKVRFPNSTHIYTYKARQDNWKKASIEIPNLKDDFVLWSKEDYEESRKNQEIFDIKRKNVIRKYDEKIYDKELEFSRRGATAGGRWIKTKKDLEDEKDREIRKLEIELGLDKEE